MEDTREEVIELPNAPNYEHESSCAVTSTENVDDEADNQQNEDDDVEDEQTSSTSDCLLSSLQVREKHTPLNLTL